MPSLETVMLCVAQLALIGLGSAMIVRPETVIRRSRDDDDERGISAGEISRNRIAGLFLVGLGFYLLYAVLVGLPRAEFFPV